MGMLYEYGDEDPFDGGPNPHDSDAHPPLEPVARILPLGQYWLDAVRENVAPVLNQPSDLFRRLLERSQEPVIPEDFRPATLDDFHRVVCAECGDELRPCGCDLTVTNHTNGQEWCAACTAEHLDYLAG